MRNGSSTLAELRSSAPSSFTIVRAAAARSRTSPGAAGWTVTRRAMPHDGGVHRNAVHVLRDQAELVLQGAVEDRCRRGHVGSEDLNVETLEASNRAETVALALGGGNCRLPVGLDAEFARADRVPLAAGEEHDRLVRDCVGTPLQEGAGILRVHPSDVDAVDRHAIGQSRRRAGEDEAQNDGRRDDRDAAKRGGAGARLQCSEACRDR